MPAAERDWFRDIPGNTEDDFGTCTVGSATEHPCPRPATRRLGLTEMCEEHYREATVQSRCDDYRSALALLESWVYEARGHGLDEFEEELARLKCGIQARLDDIDGLRQMLTDAADSHKRRGDG